MIGHYEKDNGVTRNTHLVGGVPAASDRAAMAQMLDYLGPTVLHLPDGAAEGVDCPGRANWIQPELRAVPSLPGVIARRTAAGDLGGGPLSLVRDHAPADRR
jgi:hypothetical protein